ncbi:MAG: sensor histidine kinase [Thermoleophilaceae bacterium]|nr:sensor histidine kinase [Thermoleophilaceae bacterium]
MATQAITNPRAAWKQAILPGDFQSLSSESGRTARDWVVDWVLFLLSSGFGVLFSLDQGGTLWLLNAAGGAIACVSLFWRRSHPLAVGIIASVGSCVSGAAGLAWLVILYNSALRLDRNGLIWVIGIGVVGIFTYPALYPAEVPFLVLVVLCVGVAGAALGSGVLARARREHVMALAAASQVAQGEQRLREQQAREAERHRIAREMHDVMAHRISILSLHAGALEYRPDIPPEEISKAAGVIRASAQSALEELRDIIGVMRTGADEGNDPPQPGIADVPSLVQRFREAGVRVEFENAEMPVADLSPAAGRTLYRVIQEGLTNASKHAPGAVVTVNVDRVGESRVAVTVDNPLSVGAGPGAVTLSEPGVGLVGLRERVELIGGELSHGLTTDHRFELRAEIPMSDD